MLIGSLTKHVLLVKHSNLVVNLRDVLKLISIDAFGHCLAKQVLCAAVTLACLQVDVIQLDVFFFLFLVVLICRLMIAVSQFFVTLMI